MTRSLRLMAILAHPDDESLGFGGTLARYAAEGVETFLLTATHGERGWFGKPEEYPGPVALAGIREKELYAAAEVLGLNEVILLDYMDGELDQASPDEVVPKLVAHLRRIRPDVVLTFDPFGAYGHPDHIAICQLTTAALMRAADASYLGHRVTAPHCVSKLYYMVGIKAQLEAYQQAFGELVMMIDGVERRGTGWSEWAINTRIDTAAYRDQVWQAIACHRSQLPGYEALQHLPDAQRLEILGHNDFYRAFSLVNGGRDIETDLFEGIRQTVKEFD